MLNSLIMIKPKYLNTKTNKQRKDKMRKKRKEEELAKSAEDLAKAGARFASTTIKIAYDVWERAKIRALKRGISLAKFIEDALRRELGEEEKK